MKVEIYVDAAASKKKTAAAMVVILDVESQAPWQFGYSKNMGKITKNQAELKMVEFALKAVVLFRKEEIKLYTDSIYLINVLKKGCAARKNVALVNKVRKMLKGYNIEIVKIPKEGNQADPLVRAKLKE